MSKKWFDSLPKLEQDRIWTEYKAALKSWEKKYGNSEDHMMRAMLRPNRPDSDFAENY
ncbi:MAG: hypothetical protein Unbinned4388contig1000_43 [Prokaryotic dsDNA virus sp.]|nr:MAG: hypothetical protein Unbinned4388contig1000_43 [Prokaryotic dsDNA virus sp.]|tara:strand:- start:61189 stop:61362 length:174 start_codon:yes stop_codon:yes gene_type:complete